MGRARSWGATGLLLLAAGCSEPPAPTDAGSADDAAVVAPVVALPAWGECPAGWSARTLEGATACAPPPRVACTGATFQRLDQPGCEPVDDACVTSGFRAELPTDRPVVYVDASATAGGDGSAAHPFATLDAALAAGTSPLGIALAAGSYTQARPLPADVVLVGACAASVRLVGPMSGAALSVVAGTRAHVEGVTLTGDGFGIASRGTLVLHDVVADTTRTVGIAVLGGSATITRALARGIRSDAQGQYGRGVQISNGAAVTLEDVVVEGAHEAGVSVESSTLEAHRLVVRGTVPNDRGQYGIGLAAITQSTVTIGDALVGGSADLGIQVNASQLTLDRLIVMGEGTDALGLIANDAGARVVLTRSWLEDTAGSGLAAGADSLVEAHDVVVASTRLRGGIGSAIGATAGGHVVLDRVAVVDAGGVGVIALRAALEATDLTVHGVTEFHDIGEALLVGDGAHADVDRFDFARAQVVGIMATGTGTTASIRNGSVTDVRPGATFDVGRGVEVDRDAALTLEHVRVRGVIETGILSYGQGVAGTTLTMNDVRVEDLHERACAATTCAAEGGGTAVTALAGGAIHATAIEIDGAPLCGLQVAENGALDVTSGVVSRSAIGACVQVDGYDLHRILDAVSFVDDERNLDTTSVYVPPRAPAP